MALDQKGIGEALGRIASGVFVITAGKGDKGTGFVASWVQQAAFEPPLVSLAVKQGRAIQTLIESGEPFVVHVLGEGQKKIISHFAKGFAPGEAAFEGVAVKAGVTGAPVIDGVTAYLECKFHSKTAAGDHVIYLGEVVAGGVGDEAEPDVRLRKNGLAY